MDNLKDCIVEIINTVKEDNVANYIEEIKDHMSIDLNLFFRHTN